MDADQTNAEARRLASEHLTVVRDYVARVEKLAAQQNDLIARIREHVKAAGEQLGAIDE